MGSHLNATEFQIGDTQTITGISTSVTSTDSSLSTSKAIKDFIDYAVEPTSLTVSGNWTNPQYTSQPVDTTGLSFIVTYGSGKTASVTPSVLPSKWSSTIGTQTATFSHTERGVTVSASKSASVIRKLISLTIGGSWTNTQYTGQSVDYTGLTFTANYNNGTTATVSPSSYSPTTWGDTVGTQSCTFYYSENGITVNASKSANVKNPVDPVLNNNDWATISTVAKAGTASQYWSVGDYKEVSVAAGTVDQMSVVASTYRAVIIGINHNPTYENPNSIDFAIGQNTRGTDISFYNSTGVRINASNTTAGGWTGSQMYLTYLPQFYNLLSGNTGLQDTLIAPRKYTHNTEGGSDNNTASNVTLSEDPNYKMFLMSEFEIYGTRSYANSYEQNKQAQYEYYSSSGLAKSKIRYRSDTEAASNWWERSACCISRNTDSFCSVNHYGINISYSHADFAIGLVPCFRVGLKRRERVGGTIFYIDSSSTNTYTFYDANGNPVDAPTVGTDCTDWTYEKTGSGADKFYVYESTTGLIPDKYWGYYDIITSATGKSIGDGKTNTSKVLAITDTSSYASGSIWEYIKNMRTNRINNCDDWFVGCQGEYDQLRSSGTAGASWFSSNNIWSSRESNVGYAYGWLNEYSIWISRSRSDKHALVPLRAF